MRLVGFVILENEDVTLPPELLEPFSFQVFQDILERIAIRRSREQQRVLNRKSEYNELERYELRYKEL